jgi:hypothetical protein
MRAKVFDPVGPSPFRLLPWFLSPVAFLLACLLPVGDLATSLLFIASGGLFCLTPFVPLRMKPRQAQLEFHPGYVAVKNAGRMNQKIRAKDILGATTALVPEGVLLTLNHKKRKNVPIQIVVKSLDEVKTVRDALGIGHDGFGTVFFSTDSRTGQMADGVMRGAALLGFLGAAVTRITDSGDGYIAFIVLAIIAAVVGLLARASGSSSVAPYIAMRADGVHVFGQQGWRVIPYAAIAGISERADGIAIQLHPPYPPVFVKAKPTQFMYQGLSAEERSLAVAQMLSASQRAHGGAAPKPEVTTRVDILKRNGEAPRAWLARLDVAAQTVGNQSYRGGTLDEGDLWTILEDPDADVEMRAASARILKDRSPDARVRVDTIIGAVRQDTAQKRIRIALTDDLETAGREMELLEQEEMRKMIHR